MQFFILSSNWTMFEPLLCFEGMNEWRFSRDGMGGVISEMNGRGYFRDEWAGLFQR